MGLFGIDSKSTSNTYAQQVAASEGSLAVGAGGKYIEGGGIDLSGSNAPELGPKLNAGGDISISSSDPEVLKTALEAYRDQSLSSTSAFSSFAKQIEEQKAQDLATSLAAIGQLKQSTDEQAQQRKTFLYLVLGILAVLAVLFYPRK